MTTAIVRVNGELLISENSNYQGFIFDAGFNICAPTNRRCILKWRAVEGVFPRLVQDRTFMDIGASFGFFCFKALQHGAKLSIGLERNLPYYEAVQKALAQCPVPKMKWVNHDWPATGNRADVVMILAVIHHLFPQRPLERILDDLFACSNHWVIAEWISREDKQVRRKGFADKHPEYNQERFLALARKRFRSVRFLGNSHHATRFVYLMEK